MLAHVGDQEQAVVVTKTIQQRVHLLRADQTGFIEHMETPGPLGCFVLLDQVPLQRDGRNASISQLLSRP